MFEKHTQNKEESTMRKLGRCKVKRSFLKLLLVSVVVVFMSGTVYAYPEVYLKETGVSPSSQGTFHFPVLGDVGGVLYGQYNLAIDWDKGTLNYVPINGFCVENAYSTSGDRVTYELIPVADWGQNYKNAAWVFSQYKMNLVSAQAAQIAIWELVMDPGNLNPNESNGNFYAKFSNGYVDEASYLLNNFNIGNYNGGGFVIAHSPVSSVNPENPQDYIIYTAEPSILLLLGFGMVGLVGFGRKFRKQS
jgi:hypothetical protein